MLVTHFIRIQSTDSEISLHETNFTSFSQETLNVLLSIFLTVITKVSQTENAPSKDATKGSMTEGINNYKSRRIKRNKE